MHPISNVRDFTLKSNKSILITSAFTFTFTALRLHDGGEECVDGFLRLIDKVIDVVQNAQNVGSIDIFFNIPELNQKPIDVTFIVPQQSSNNFNLR